MVSLISSSVKESSDEVASSNTRRLGRRNSARAMERRCFSPPETFTPPSPISVSSPLSARARRLWHAADLQNGHTVGVGRRGVNKEEILANGSGEKLGVLSHQSNAIPQPVKIDIIDGNAVVPDVPGLRPIEPDQQFDKRGFSGA